MYKTGQFPTTRMRRLRNHAIIRQLVQETKINISKLILPIFIKDTPNLKHPISSMPGHFQLSLDYLEEEIKLISELGLQSILLFGIPAVKDCLGSDSYSDNGIIQRAIPIIKKIAPNLLVISDVCFCEYTDHGHCGVVENEEINNDKTLELLGRQAVSHAKAGVDIVAPSGNIDGMVTSIRTALDREGFSNVPILSYGVKYASSLYGPFREAAEGAPKFGNRKTYQMDYSNANEALRETALDIDEGADMIIVKPAHTYLDIINRVKTAFPAIPVAAYHTSGEFAMLKAAASKGYINEKEGVKEILTAIFRAGADFIITYYAKEIASWINEKEFPCATY